MNSSILIYLALILAGLTYAAALILVFQHAVMTPKTREDPTRDTPTTPFGPPTHTVGR